MKYQRDLQVRLQERYRRIMKADFQVHQREVAYFRDFIQSTPALKAIINTLETSSSNFEPEQWVADHFKNRGYDWPDTELKRARVCWHLVNELAAGTVGQDVVWAISSERNYNVIYREVTEAIIEPFVEFLQEKLGTESDILYLLEKYKRRLEWFERARLFEAFEADRRRGEAKYDSDLRQFLFDQGIDYPFSQPASVSGKADVVAGLDFDDPLVCELKLFDGENYGLPYLAKGAGQAIQYAQDYGKVAAHLVVINLTDRELELPSDAEPGIWPPRLYVVGLTLFLIQIRGKPLPPASQRKAAAPARVSRADLLPDQSTGSS